MKTVIQALRDETIYPVPIGKIEVILIKRELNGEKEFTKELSDTKAYKGASADCLFSLLQAVNVSEAGLSVGALTDAQRKTILRMANDLYEEIGEEPKDDPLSPAVYIENWR